MKASVFCAATCFFACGARTSLDSNAGDGGGISITLTIPLGAYAGCTSTMVTVGQNFEGTSGGLDGSITLTQEGNGVAAALACTPFASGNVAFTPTSETSAVFAAGESFDVDTVDFQGSPVTVTATTGSLALVGETLFVSLHGESGTDEVSAYFTCPVSASLIPTSIVTNVPPVAPLTTGVYGSCTSSLSSSGPVTVLAGGSGTVTVTETAEVLRATWNGLTSVCGSIGFGFDFTATSGSAAPLAVGQTCNIEDPCGPPPSLGPSQVPSTATMTNEAGSMTVDGHSLFINIVGDTTPLTCGTHYVSIICAGPGP